MYKQAIILMINPVDPFIQNQPGLIPALLFSRCGRMAARYERLDSKTKDPTKALKAVEEPR